VLPPLKKSKLPLCEVSLHLGLNLLQAPTLSDFSDTKIQVLLLWTMYEYEILVCTQRGFPSLTLCAQWAEACFLNVQKDAEKEEGDEGSSWFEFTDWMLRLVCNNVPLFYHY